MLAGIITRPNEIVVKDVEVPKTEPDEVLIRVKYCGICGTDLHIFNGSYSSEYLPLIPGHEFFGTVVEVGSQVKKFIGGELVTADINLGCGDCFYCRHNQILMCKDCKQIGIHTNGAFAEYVSVPSNKVYRLPEGVSIKNWALIEPIACVIRSAKKSGLSFAKSVVIIGAGPMGLLQLQMAKNCGCAPIIVVEKNIDRLNYAKKMGADYVVSIGEDNVNEVKKITEGRGADFVIESVGRISTYKKSFEFVRPGGRIVVFGMTKATEEVSFRPCEMVLTEISMTSSIAGMGNDILEAITMVKYDKFLLEPFTSVVYPLKELSKAFESAQNDKSIIKNLVKI